MSGNGAGADASAGGLFSPETLSIANNAGGDRTAVNQLLRRVERRMRRLARFVARQDRDVDPADLAVRSGQRLLLGASSRRTGRWESPKHLRNAWVQAMGWVLADHAKARLRQARRDRPHAGPQHRPPKPLAEVAGLDVGKLYGGDPAVAIDVIDGLDKLERDHPDWHAVVVRRVYGGQTFSQAGADLGIPAETARNRYHRGSAALSHILRAHRPPGSAADESLNS